LTGHSINTPPLVSTLASDWFLAGTVIPSTRSLVISAGVPNRMGYIWSKYPLLTNDFEIEVEFSITGPEQRSVKGEGFAVWYVQDNVTASMDNITNSHLHNQDEILANTFGTAFSAEKFDLFGYRSHFNGIGVFFTDGGQNKDSPTIGGFANDGSIDGSASVPTPNATQHNFRKGDKVTAKIRVQPKSFKVEVGGVTQEIKADTKTGGYIGISVYTGTKGKVEVSEKSDFVEFWKFSVTNHDVAQKGEDLPSKLPAPATTKAPENKEDLMHEMSSRKDHRAESEAIKELTNMVFKLVVESQPLRTAMAKAIESLNLRVTTMEKTFETLKEEVDKRTGHKLGAEFDAIKKELTTLSRAASRETEERHKRLDSLHNDIAIVHKSAIHQDNIDSHLNKLTESNKRTLDSLVGEKQKMFGVSIAALAFILIAGFSLYNKFRCWEKKHIL